MSTPLMRAKLLVHSVESNGLSESIRMGAVYKNSYSDDGLDEDNTYSRFTPTADLHMIITNPVLLEKIKQGMKFYVDFTPVEDN